MRRSFLCVFILTVIVVSNVVAFTPVDNRYLYPIAARTNGVGGTVWKTEMCFYNSWDFGIRVNLGLFNNGAVVVAGYVNLGPRETACYPDIFDTLGTGNGSGFMIVYSQNEEAFFTRSRIYNDAATGEYGQNIPPVGSRNAFGGIPGGQPGILTGTKNIGSAGSWGARTNIGIVNISDETRLAMVLECEGVSCVGYDVTVGPYTVVQFPMHESLTAGSIGVGGNELLLAYASTIDNKSGDAVFQGHCVFDVVDKSNPIAGKLLGLTHSRNLQPGGDSRIPSDLISMVKELAILEISAD